MAFLTIRRLRVGTALGLFLAVSAPALAQEAKPADEGQAAQVQFDVSAVDTFAGAFLAARTADNDYDYETAIKLYRTALKFEPGNVEVRERLMVSLFMNGNFDDGVVEATRLKDDPAVERIAVIALGIDAIRNKKFADAYQMLKYNGPNELDRMVNTLLIAWGQFGEGKSKEALATIETMKGPDWYSVFRNYSAGMIALAAGDLDMARRKLNDTIANRDEGSAASDTYMRAVVALAGLEARAGNKQKALDAIAIGEAFAPGYVPLQAFHKQIDAGVKPEVPITNATEGAASVLFSVGGALNQSLSNSPDRQGAQDIVSFYLVTSHALAPKDADTSVLLGGLAESLDQPERAIRWYKQVGPNSPLRRISELQLGLNLAATGKVDDARKHLKAAIAADPKDIRGYVAYGSLLSDNKEYEEMAKVYDKAVEVIGPVTKRSDWSVFFQRGIAYERLKKWSEAEPSFKKALQLYPDQPQVLNYLGYSWVDMNIHLDEGLNMIRKAVDLRPDDGYIVDSLGWAYFRLNRFDDAVGELERAVELKASDATINDHLGDAYWRVGRKLEAIFQWRTALEMKPEEAEIPKIQKKIKEGLPPIEAIAVPKSEPVTRAVAVAQADPVKQPAVKPADAQKQQTEEAPAQPAGADDTGVKPTDAGATSPADQSHTVVKGDSLWNIAREILGDGHRFREIIDLNPELRRYPDRLQPGQLLKLPATKN
ncbi:tetratricopeptide repeat protein [Rhizobium sp. KVB221]|uniref:Tetratricopeptide repeat protein n=1 Tax=Rhizobium setariae TaxID=2801340 RepID=A0A936YIA4_9HYPH|nr:tetratricopeptide repeat protein [Rhizobium setariae]MBL0370769.1 tetratricopeptide repeat protein [Rhizobium setariae]